LILDFFKIALKLKTVKRQGWIDKLSIKNPESVADHTFSMAIIGMILADNEEYDTEKILKMILLHDLAESITGDLTPDKIDKDEKILLENKTFENILNNLPKILQKQYLQIWNEYQENKSKDSKFVHQIDKLELALQAEIYSKKNISKKNILPFFESAQKEISDPNLLKLFKQLTNN